MLISMHTFCICKFFFLNIQFFVGWLIDDGKIFFYFFFNDILASFWKDILFEVFIYVSMILSYGIC